MFDYTPWLSSPVHRSTPGAFGRPRFGGRAAPRRNEIKAARKRGRVARRHARSLARRRA